MTSVEWCEPDECPASICGGPHREVETSLGVELLRADQQPIGTPAPPCDCPFCPDPTHGGTRAAEVATARYEPSRETPTAKDAET